MTVSIERTAPDHPDALLLLEASDAHSAALYPAESRFGLGVAALIAQDARFFIARDAGGEAAGCGGFVLTEPGTAEVKRMFVDERFRGQGIAQVLLRAIEAGARADGARLMQLETGVNSTAAQRLYESFGYRWRGPFGAYPDDPLCVFMERALSE